MTDSPFDNLEFTSDSGSQTPDEFIDIIHDPDVLYHYITDAHAKTKHDLTIDTDEIENTADVRIHAKVEVFQSAMQYVEAFGIYLLAYIKEHENLIDDLIKTRPGDVQTFFEHLQNDRIDEWLTANDIDDDYQTALETIFGYLYLDTVEHPDDGELTDDELDAEIKQSTAVIDDELRAIGEFYTTFGDIYNAVKHGNRALPQTENTFRITPSQTNETTENEAEAAESESITTELDMNFVLFVCKNNNGNPYLTALPIDYLLDHTLAIVEKTHHLFTHIKTISHAVINEEPFDVSFFSYPDPDGEDTDETVSDWVVAQHPSGILILPRTDETAALQTEPHEWTFAARLTLDNNTLELHTRNNTDPSPEYPVSVSIMQNGIVGLTPQPIMNITLNFTLGELDAIQYHDLLQIQDLVNTNSLNQIKIIDEQADKEFPAGTLDNFPLPEIESFIDRELIEQVALLQKITQRHIPAPLTVSDDQQEIIEQSINEDLTREHAIEIVDELEQLGENDEHTVITVEKHQPDSEVLDSKIIGAPPGTIDIEITDIDGETHADDIKNARIPTEITDTTYDELVTWLQSDPDALDTLVAQIPHDLQAPTVPTRVYLRYQPPEDGFWFRKHELTIEVLAEEFDLHPPIRCELCGQETRDVQQHLLEACPTLHDSPSE